MSCCVLPWGICRRIRDACDNRINLVMASVQYKTEAEAPRADSHATTNDQDKSFGATALEDKSVKTEVDTPRSSTAESYQKIDPPPNGGLLAWLQVLGSFFLYFNCWYVAIQAQSRIDPAPVFNAMLTFWISIGAL